MTEVCSGPPESIWDLITDWEHQDDWMLEASDFVVVSDVREGVGVEAEATIRIGGITTRDRVRVGEWDPPRRLVIEHLGWVTGRGIIELTPVAGRRTHVWWREELSPPLGVLGAIGMTAFKPLMARVFRRDLRILAGLARAAAR
ncbi:MAG TPA: SRPBCC family protein [Actinomycetota bacterium]|nr:SRPBCC family protein [Actinomycetota bacterium]